VQIRLGNPSAYASTLANVPVDERIGLMVSGAYVHAQCAQQSLTINETNSKSATRPKLPPVTNTTSELPVPTHPVGKVNTPQSNQMWQLLTTFCGSRQTVDLANQFRCVFSES
jgi:hypothetical protein